MYKITMRCENKHLTINVPSYVEEITVEFPPNGRGDEKPLIILTDRT